MQNMTKITIIFSNENYLDYKNLLILADNGFKYIQNLKDGVTMDEYVLDKQ
ncbi:hypothetical protein [Terrisporobacter petrolearius]|uniref:hypothetical protein n=1 Tax=Terrisporobacter petrolearius TaxID=1460447 RepID=UPI0031CC5B6E